MRRHRLRKRYGHARRRYGHSGHPLLPRLVVYLEREGPRDFVIRAKLQRHYGGPWETVATETHNNVRDAREAHHSTGDSMARLYGVPRDHVEFVP